MHPLKEPISLILLILLNKDKIHIMDLSMFFKINKQKFLFLFRNYILMYYLLKMQLNIEKDFAFNTDIF